MALFRRRRGQQGLRFTLPQRSREVCPLSSRATPQPKKKRRYIPDIITGDLDSLRSDVGDYYKAHGVLLRRDGDQNSTDLQKSIGSVKASEATSSPKGIILLGGLSGRLDQTMHTLSALHRLRKERSELFVVTDESVAWVLDKVCM